MWFRFAWPETIQDAIERDGVAGLVGGGPTTVFVDGCGVSGFDERDCLALVREHIFHGEQLPEVRDRVPDVDVATLPEQLRDHLGNPSRRGVWFPTLNLQSAPSARP
jgi:hypothetical protein